MSSSSKMTQKPTASLHYLEKIYIIRKISYQEKKAICLLLVFLKSDLFVGLHFLFFSIGPSRQYPGWWKDKSSDGVGLFREDSGNWNQSEF